MSYIALYRKFRPKSFDEIKGQDQVTTILKNQIKGERIGHAYLFSGTRGTGKTSAAKILAKAVNCENPVDGNPCLLCESCKRIEDGRNLNVIEIDAASTNGVENIREIIEEVRYSPTEGRYKVYIIDEVHMLSTGAFNALLKTLEEPPSYVIFILATTEIHKIPVTILSRCQRYDFRRITAETIGGRIKELLLSEGETFEEEAVDFIARKGDGSMRDALSLLDQCLSFYFGEKLTFENVLAVLGAVDVDTFLRLFYAIRRQDAGACLDIVEDISLAGLDFGQFVTDFNWFLRNLILLLVSPEAERRIDVSKEKIKLMKEAVLDVSEEEIAFLMNVISKLAAQIKNSSQKRAELEIALIGLVRPEMKKSEDALLARLIKLEKKVAEGVFSPVKEGEEQKKEETLSSPEPAKKPAETPRKALPEEIKKIAGVFSTIISKQNIKQPLRSFLKEVTPLYDEAGDSLVLATGDELTKEMLEMEGNLSVLKKNMEEAAGGELKLKVKLIGDAKREGNTEILGIENINPALLFMEE